MPNQFSSSSSPFSFLPKPLPKLKSWFRRQRSSDPRSQPPHKQVNSQLLSTLPLELRLQIYAYVLQSYGSFQHIHLVDGKLTHMRCVSPTSHVYFQTESARHGVCDPWDPAHRKSVQNGWEIVPLLLSCRQTYLEFIEVLYSSIIFHLPTYAAARFFATVPDAHLALVQLHLLLSIFRPMYLPLHKWPNGFTTANTNPKADETEWENVWRALARVRVRSLLVEIFDHGVRVPEQTLLAPLRHVAAGKFEVVLPWPVGLKTSGEFEDAGFVVRRPPESVGTDLMVQIDVDTACSVPRSFERSKMKLLRQVNG